MKGDQVSQTIRDLAEHADLSLAQVQRRTGISRATFHRRLKDGRWEVPQLGEVAKALGVTAAALLDGQVAA